MLSVAAAALAVQLQAWETNGAATACVPVFAAPELPFLLHSSELSVDSIIKAH